MENYCDFCEGEDSCTCVAFDPAKLAASEAKMKDVKVCDLKSDTGDCEACGA